jgi:ubiquinone/menaquinone biosynthesis C-methylase UbiE
VGNATELPYLDDQFDLVISINTIHNLNEDECGMAIREIERVSRKNAFIVVDAYTNEEEKQRMYDWNLTALTIKSNIEWKKFFKENGYTKDYYWFMP